MTIPWAHAAFERLTASSRTLAIAEICTGGLVSADITSFSGSERVFRGAVVVGADNTKMNALKVSKELLEKKGPVCPEVAIAMAVGARKQFDADVGVAVTALSLPGSGGPSLPVGTVWFAFVDDSRQETLSEHVEGELADIRSSATCSLFRYLALFLDNNPA